MLRLTLLLLLSLTFNAGAESASDDLQKGLGAYQNKQYAEAQTAFQKVLETKKNSPAVLNDLALTAVQLEQKPLALALWRKALAISPNYEPARDGRDLLEKQMALRPFERDSFSTWEHRGLERLPLQLILFLNALVLGLAGLLWIRYFGLRNRAVDEESEMPAFPTWATVATLILLGSLFVVGVKASDTLSDRATVLPPKASVHSLPSADGVSLFDVSGGSEVLVKRQQGEWIQVQNGDGASGWVKGSDVLITSER